MRRLRGSILGGGLADASCSGCRVGGGRVEDGEPTLESVCVVVLDNSGPSTDVSLFLDCSVETA